MSAPRGAGDRRDRRGSPARSGVSRCAAPARSRYVDRVSVPPRHPQSKRRRVLPSAGIHESVQPSGWHRRLVTVGRSVRPALLTTRHGRADHRVDTPLLIDFATPSSILREQNRISALPIVGNGPPGTFVLFPDQSRCRCRPIRSSSPTTPAATRASGSAGCSSWAWKEQTWCSPGFESSFRRTSSHPPGVTRCGSTCSVWPASPSKGALPGGLWLERSLPVHEHRQLAGRSRSPGISARMRPSGAISYGYGCTPGGSTKRILRGENRTRPMSRPSERAPPSIGHPRRDSEFPALRPPPRIAAAAA